MDNAEYFDSRTSTPFWFRAIGTEGECSICDELIQFGELIGRNGFEQPFHEDCISGLEKIE